MRGGAATAALSVASRTENPLLKETRSRNRAQPLRGKLLNVRDANHSTIMGNKEISELKQILGLQQGKDYTDANARKGLRYGHLMIMADQDHDGSHIKGLLINFIHHFWPSLMQIPGFLQQFITPIVKVWVWVWVWV